jgi:hypothetical protein
MNAATLGDIASPSALLAAWRGIRRKGGPMKPCARISMNLAQNESPTNSSDQSKWIGLFHRRRNDDGTFDSICLACFRTAASSPEESELNSLERGHVCDRAQSDFVRYTSNYAYLAKIQPIEEDVEEGAPPGSMKRARRYKTNTRSIHIISNSAPRSIRNSADSRRFIQ